MANFIWTKTQRGKRMLIYNNFFYTFNSEKNEIETWRCRTRSCKGRIFFKKNEEILNLIEHNHIGNKNEVIAYLSLQKIKIAASSNFQRASSLVSAITAQETKKQ